MIFAILFPMAFLAVILPRQMVFGYVHRVEPLYIGTRAITAVMITILVIISPVYFTDKPWLIGFLIGLKLIAFVFVLIGYGARLLNWYNTSYGLSALPWNDSPYSLERAIAFYLLMIWLTSIL